jgi:hypothetical protein
VGGLWGLFSREEELDRCEGVLLVDVHALAELVLGAEPFRGVEGLPHEGLLVGPRDIGEVWGGEDLLVLVHEEVAQHLLVGQLGDQALHVHGVAALPVCGGPGELRNDHLLELALLWRVMGHRIEDAAGA